MASQMQINQLPVIPQAPANDDVLAIEVNGITYKVSKSALASAILGTIDTTPTQSSTRLVQSGGVYNAIQQSTANMTVKASNSWGTTVSWTQNNGLSMIIIGNYHLVIVWGASTSDVNVLVINPNGTYSKSGKNNEVKFGGVSTDETFIITRSNNNMTLTCATNQTVKVLT